MHACERGRLPEPNSAGVIGVAPKPVVALVEVALIRRTFGVKFFVDAFPLKMSQRVLTRCTGINAAKSRIVLYRRRVKSITISLRGAQGDGDFG
jgi:hypothetical protein